MVDSIGRAISRSALVNWESVVRYFIRSVEADAAADGSPEVAALLDRLMAYQGVSEALRKVQPDEPRNPVLPMHFRKEGTDLSLFTTIATLGTPQDIALEELRVESFFPMNDPTTQVFRRWQAP